MSLSNFNTPPVPIAVALDLLRRRVRFGAVLRQQTDLSSRSSPRPSKAADIKAAREHPLEYDDAPRTLSNRLQEARNRSSRQQQSTPSPIERRHPLPPTPCVRCEAGLATSSPTAWLGHRRAQTDPALSPARETGPLNLRSGVGEIPVEGVTLRLGGTAAPATSGSAPWTAKTRRRLHRQLEGAVGGCHQPQRPQGPPTVWCPSTARCPTSTAAGSNGRVRIGEFVRGEVSARPERRGVEFGVREGSAAWLELDTGVGPCLQLSRLLHGPPIPARGRQGEVRHANTKPSRHHPPSAARLAWTGRRTTVISATVAITPTSPPQSRPRPPHVLRRETVLDGID